MISLPEKLVTLKSEGEGTFTARDINSSYLLYSIDGPAGQVKGTSLLHVVMLLVRAAERPCG